MDPTLSFRLPKEFIEKQRTRDVKNNNCSDSIRKVVMIRTYSRAIWDDKTNKIIKYESYHDIIERVVCGLFSLLKDHLEPLGKWNDEEMAERAMHFYDLVFDFKITPPGRGFWALGTKLVHTKKLALPLVNCTFVSSSNIDVIGTNFFAYLMDALMLGVGVGFDDRGAGKLPITRPKSTRDPRNVDDILFLHQQFLDESKKFDMNEIPFIQHEIDFVKTNPHSKIFQVDDTREGWVKAVTRLIASYIRGKSSVIFDYSKIREKGIPLKTFGGTSSGALPLIEGIAMLRFVLEKNINEYESQNKNTEILTLNSKLIVDICNIISTIVIAGNVRRSSQIFLSKRKNAISYKDYLDPLNKYRELWAGSSNNSFIIDDTNYKNRNDIFDDIAPYIKNNGEPGIFNLYNVSRYGRLSDEPDHKDKADGTNPCGEISLEGKNNSASEAYLDAGGETCNLSETYPCNYEGNLREVLKQYGDDLYYAVLICKAVTLIEPHWKGTAEIQNRNRRIGVSQTGINDFLAKHDIDIMTDNGYQQYADILDMLYHKVCTYDTDISSMLEIPESIRKTTVKPSGTTTICAGLNSSGMHVPISNYYIRRVRISNTEKEIIECAKQNGFQCEPDVYSKGHTTVISFPCKTINENVITRDKISMEYQFRLMELLQRYWSDNQVSCTISFKENERDDIVPMLKKYITSIKGISMLPLDNGCYPQMPEEIISKDQYEELMSGITTIEYSHLERIVQDDGNRYEIEIDNYCSGDKCVLPKKKH